MCTNLLETIRDPIREYKRNQYLGYVTYRFGHCHQGQRDEEKKKKKRKVRTDKWHTRNEEKKLMTERFAFRFSGEGEEAEGGGGAKTLFFHSEYAMRHDICICYTIKRAQNSGVLFLVADIRLIS